MLVTIDISEKNLFKNYFIVNEKTYFKCIKKTIFQNLLEMN